MTNPTEGIGMEFTPELSSKILAIIINPKTRTLRSKVSSSGDATQQAARYVWKMARVFGGQDGFNMHRADDGLDDATRGGSRHPRAT